MDFIQVNSNLLIGFGNTVLLFFASLVLAIPLGVLVCRLRLSKIRIVEKVMRFIIWVIRGTPLMLQIIVIFYIPGIVFDIRIESRIVAAIVAFAINYAVYFGEIYRAGYTSIPRGQHDAATSLGLSKNEEFFKIVLPQTVKKIIPPMTSETISLVKDTALARVISVGEIIYEAQKIVSTHAIIWVLLYTGVFYLVFNGMIGFLSGKLEKKLSYYGE